MNLPPAPENYIRNIWQQILEAFKREDMRNVKRDAAFFSSGVRFTGAITPSQIGADQNNYNPAGLSNANVLRVSSDAARTVTGLAAQPSGELVLLMNVGSFNVTLANESSSSTAENRFAIGANALLAPGHGTLLWYDVTSSRWRIVARSNATFG